MTTSNTPLITLHSLESWFFVMNPGKERLHIIEPIQSYVAIFEDFVRMFRLNTGLLTFHIPCMKGYEEMI